MANHTHMGTTRLSIDMPAQVLDAFKLYLQATGRTQREVIIELVTNLIDQHRAGEKTTPRHTQDWTEIIDWVRNKA